MSAAREKDQADFDLETFVDLFDTAMSSDNPAVKKALRNLIMISAIVNAENADATMRKGPLRRVIDDQNNIIRRLDRIENERVYPQSPTTIPTPYIPNMPSPWGPTIGPNTTTQWPPGTITCNTASSTSSEDQFKSYSTLLEKLENK